MTTATLLDAEVDLQRKYTAEERDEILDAYIKALETGDNDEADKALAHLPIHPRWAKIIAEVIGKDYLQETFNLTHANEVYGEGWLDEIQKKAR